jgi:hypothetical protein
MALSFILRSASSYPLMGEILGNLHTSERKASAVCLAPGGVH